MRRAEKLTAALAVVALVVAGCGGDDEGSDIVSEPAPQASEFPDPGGRTLEQLLAGLTPASDIVVSPAGATYTPGKNRFGFGVFTTDGTQITDAEVAIYAAHRGGPAKGPYPARIESLETDPSFEARTTADDPDAAKVVYVTQLPLDKPGPWDLLGVVRRGDQLAGRAPTITVGPHRQIPAPGEGAPRVHTPTVEDVGDITQIETRAPADHMHEVDLADILGEKPVVLLFATPALCQTAVCGPVVDVAEQVKSEYDDRAAFIHMEIYRNNQPPKIRPQLIAYGLRSEPWLFVLDRRGRVSTRIEGAYSVSELEAAIEKVLE